ncbi:MAG TPA: M18 family aminopeptidase [Polyangiaceae bacterium]|jgi:aspartyl aminopeptidase|nr:M18 family aminopeptidase [Polyangiaceae bacterium]
MSPPTTDESVTDLIRFIDASPTPYHAVFETARRLRENGFRELDERDEWRVAAGDRVYVVRGGSTIVALVAGGAPPSRAGFLLVAAHTDSPNLRVKPRPEQRTQGYQQLGVEVYGSPLLHTWLDRDLGIAGRVSLLDGSTHLVRIHRPICRVSNLAIHLNLLPPTEGLKLNPQTQVIPTLSLAERSPFRELLVEAIPGATSDALGAYDLALYDVQAPSVGGADDEFLYAPRLDNLASCHAALSALVTAKSKSDATIGIALYDHEEVGSQSAMGASSLFFRSVLERIANGARDAGSDAGSRALARSLLVSADMAHAIHPNFTDRHEPEHTPFLGKGPVIKVNSSQSYATDGPSAAVFERACRDAGVATQRFVARNDMRCGTTVGPISAARLSMRTVDVGNPMLSMHSCRELCATADVPKMIDALTRLFDSATVPPGSA